MSRPTTVLGGFHGHGHYAQQSPFDAAGHTGPMLRAPLPMRPPELPVAYQQQPTGPHGRTSMLRMADPAYEDDELAQLQELSNKYEPEATGPLVGDRQRSSAITTEYQNADPVFQVKTAALPSKYAFFRTCRGDGHCGWRAIAFTYYEALLRAGDVTKFEDEEARLQSMHNLLNHVGYSDAVYEDFAEEAFALSKRLAASLHALDGTAADVLLQVFNDYSSSMAIITYFKLLASAWIQSHPNDYLPFLLDYPDVKSYCEANMDRAVAEIDHVAMAALGEVLIKPAGFGIEVLYLDRSPGTEINNTFRIEPAGADSFSLSHGPTMRLLYRPGHYDILYKAEDIPSPVPAQAPLHVALAGYTDEFVPMASNMSDVMTLIPGMYPTSIGAPRWSSVSYDYNQAPAPPPQITPVPAYAPTPTPAAPVASSHQEYVAPIHTGHVNHHNPPSHHGLQLEPPVTLPMHPPHPQPPPMGIDRAPPVSIERGGPFRPSVYELEGFGTGRVHSLPFQTSIFRNSHYNTAHFLNPDFQPEEWSPDSEYAPGNRGRHKSTSQ